RALAQRPDPELHVQPRYVHEGPPILRRVFGGEQRGAGPAYAPHVAEALGCGAARVLRTHAPGDVVADALLDMESQFLVDLVLGAPVHRRVLSRRDGWPSPRGSRRGTGAPSRAPAARARAVRRWSADRTWRAGCCPRCPIPP